MSCHRPIVLDSCSTVAGMSPARRCSGRPSSSPSIRAVSATERDSVSSASLAEAEDDAGEEDDERHDQRTPGKVTLAHVGYSYIQLKCSVWTRSPGTPRLLRASTMAS